MTRVLVQRGSSGSGSSSNSNSNTNRAGSSSTARAEPQVAVPPAVKDEEIGEDVQGVVVVGDEVLESSECSKGKSDELLMSGSGIHFDQGDDGSSCDDDVAAVVVEKDVKEEVVCPRELVKGLSGVRISERVAASENEGSIGGSCSLPSGGGVSSCPPPPPVPPPKPSAGSLNSRRNVTGNSNSCSVGSSRRASAAWPVVSARTSPAGSRPSSPRSHDSEGYNSADEQKPCFVSSYDDFVSY